MEKEKTIEYFIQKNNLTYKKEKKWKGKERTGKEGKERNGCVRKEREKKRKDRKGKEGLGNERKERKDRKGRKDVERRVNPLNSHIHR